MTLLSICQDVVREIGLIPVPSSVVGNNGSELAQRLLGVCNLAGEKLARAHDWTDLMAEFTVTLASGDADYALPADFNRFSDETLWNRNTDRKLDGPITQREWQQIQGNNINAGIYQKWRKRGNQLLITPTPAAGDVGHVIYGEYVSKNWCESSGGTDQSTWTADGDVGILDEYLIKLGIRWRLKNALGEEYAEDFKEYVEEVIQAAGRDGGNRDIVTGRLERELPRMGYIAETGYGA